MPNMMPTPSEVRAAIQAEIDASPDKLTCEIVSREHDESAKVWTLEVDLKTPRARLDESLQGVSAWWPSEAGGRGGVAEVLAVLPEDRTLHLWRYSGPLPGVGSRIYLYPRQFLESLLSVWKLRGTSCCNSLRRLLQPGAPPQVAPLAPLPTFHRLRPAQRVAFARALPLDLAWLWGPPGTGKTYTLGRMIATWLLTHDKPALLLGPTNVAVDQALVDVDKALEEVERAEIGGGLAQRARALRSRCKRVGTRYDAGRYKGRAHLIPEADPELLDQLQRHELAKPDPADVEALAVWQTQYESLRERLRNFLEQLLPSARLIAMTCVRALDGHDLLRGPRPEPRFSKLFFDEASQIGLATAAALLDLGDGALFAGDPCQLAPIVQSEHPGARDWLGRSLFLGRTPDRTVLLTEQRRMAREVCSVISEVFYGGRLKVAEDVARSAHWRAHRNLQPAEGVRGRLVVQVVDGESAWWPGMRSAVRDSSADWIVGTVRNLVHAGQSQREFLILTPFRGQRYKLQRMYREAGLADIEVSTVHRAQGGERHTVIFDPTDEGASFLKRPDTWRLVNVALSRAMARIILVTTRAGETSNELIRLMAFAMRGGVLTPFNEAVGNHIELLRGIYYTRVPEELAPPDVDQPLVGHVVGIDQQQVRFHDALSFLRAEISMQALLAWPAPRPDTGVGRAAH